MTPEEFERTRRGVRALVGGPVQYPPKLAANSLYGKRDQAIETTICTGTETCKDPSHE